MRNKRLIGLVILIMIVLLIGSGCSRYKPRPVDITKGEYYDDLEYEKMSNKDKEKYCNDLAVELDNLQNRSETAQTRLAENRETIKTLTQDLRDAEREYANLSAQVDELSKQLGEQDIQMAFICRQGATDKKLEETNTPVLCDRWGDVSKSYGALDLVSRDIVPSIVILDREGYVRFYIAGYMPKAEALGETVIAVLKPYEPEGA